MNAKHIIDSLRAHYLHTDQRGQWAFFDEFRVGTGSQDRRKSGTSQCSESRLDGFAINLWPSKDFVSIAFEVKVSRQDFWHEVKNPLKRQPAFSLSNQYYFATPPGLVNVDEVPDLCGLIEVCEAGHVTIKEIASMRMKLNPDWCLLASVARRMCREELADRPPVQPQPKTPKVVPSSPEPQLPLL